MPMFDGTLGGYDSDRWDQLTGLLIRQENDYPRWNSALCLWREGPDVGKRVWLQKVNITDQNPN